MRSITCFLLAGILLIASPGCTGNGGEARPRVKLTGIHFGELNRAALELAFDIQIKNPYSVDMPLTAMTYSLYSKNSKLAAGRANPNTTIPAGAKQKVSLPVRVHYGHILSTLKTIQPGSKIHYNAELTISANTQTLGEIQVTIKKNGKVTLPYISGVKYKRVLELLEYE